MVPCEMSYPCPNQIRNRRYYTKSQPFSHVVIIRRIGEAWPPKIDGVRTLHMKRKQPCVFPKARKGLLIVLTMLKALADSVHGTGSILSTLVCN